MSDNPNQPKEYDAVLGGQNPPPTSCVVLGGIESVKHRLASNNVEVRVAALSDALPYGDVGLDLVIQSLQSESVEVKNAAVMLLQGLNLKMHAYAYYQRGNDRFNLGDYQGAMESRNWQ